MTKTKKIELTDEEIKQLVDLIAEKYQKLGKIVTTAVKFDGDDAEILIDNREDKDVN